jgi:signal transduction histidine kinase
MDTGPGIPAEEQARIIGKQIVEMHGGRTWVESIVGRGSTFLMELPTRAEFRKSAP